MANNKAMAAITAAELIDTIRKADPVEVLTLFEEVRTRGEAERERRAAIEAQTAHMQEVRERDSMLKSFALRAQETAARVEAERRAREDYERSNEHRKAVAEAVTLNLRRG